MRFDRDRFRQYSWDLSIAVYKLSEELMLERLEQKMALVAGVGQRIADKMEARADRLIAREPELNAKTDQVFGRHEAIADKAEKTLDSLDAALNLMSNGGPPLSDAPNSAPELHGAPAPNSDGPRALWAELGQP